MSGDEEKAPIFSVDVSLAESIEVTTGRFQHSSGEEEKVVGVTLYFSDKGPEHFIFPVDLAEPIADAIRVAGMISGGSDG